MNYIQESGRTESPLHCTIPIPVEHGVIGISSEAGELMDAIKRYIYYGTPVDPTNLKEELGDIFFYIAMICRHFNWTFEEVQQLNIEKLKKRYPDKFTSEHAEKRDLEAERKILEAPAAAREFRVSWEIDVMADTPKHAAEIARMYQQDGDTTAQVFNVFEDGHFKARVDLFNDTETQ